VGKNMKFRSPAIVFGGGFTGLGIARNLGRVGVDVYCVVDRVDPVMFSKYCRKHFLIPDFIRRKNLTKSFLNQFSKKNTTRAAIFSTDDLGTLVLSHLQSELKDDYYFIVPEREAAEKLVLKTKFYHSLDENKIPHPRVIIPTCLDDLKTASKELKYPIFVRPSVSQDFSIPFRKKGFVAKSERELRKYYNLFSKQNIEILFQEIIPGPDKYIFGIAGFFNKKSNPLALFAYHRLRGWPLMFGNNCLIESVAISTLPDLKEIAIRYLESIGYYGIMEAEFKQDPRNGKFMLLEINARNWWQNYFPTKCGLNIVLRAYLDAIGEKVEYCENYALGIKWINLLTDIRSSILSGEITKIGWISSFRGIRDWAYFDFGDPLPFVTGLLCEIRRLM